jgi:hypothetical protein
MNAILPRVFKSVYRKEPIVSVLVIMGAVDVLIGGFDDSWPLLVFGLGTVGVALVFKLWRIQQRPPIPEEPVSQHYLPARSSSLPLSIKPAKKKPPLQ